MQNLSSSFLFFCYLLGGAALLSLVFGIESVHLLEGWHWPFHPQPLLWWPILVLGAVVASSCWLLLRYPIKPAFTIGLLFTLALSTQWAFAWSSNKGIDGMRAHGVKSGHSEFIVTASRGFQLSDILLRYEEFVLLPSQRFSPSKPPGQLLSYMALDKLARQIMPEETQLTNPLPQIIDPPHRQLLELVTLLFPFLAALSVLPLYAVSRLLHLDRPWLPPLFFIVSAPFALIVMHFDQVLYPLLSCSLWWMVAKGAQHSNLSWALGAGLLAGMSIFISFSLLPSLLLCPAIALASRTSIQWPKVLFGFIAGTFLFYLLLWFSFSYDPFLRYENAMLHHAAWKGWVNEGWLFWLASRLNVIELLWWLSPPAGLLLLYSWIEGVNNRCSITLGNLTLLLLLLVFGKTIGEVARLWIFWMPLLWLQLVKRIEKKLDDANSYWMFALLGFVFIWSVVLKWQQDFR